MNESRVEVGSLVPDVRLSSTAGDVSLHELLAQGKRVVLAFHFEDGTPACASQVAMLKDAYEAIVDLGAEVLAVSADPLDAHRAFAERLGGVPFPIASDAKLEAARAYGVVDEGDPRRSRRAVFVIDRGGALLLANRHFQSTNPSQVEALIEALAAPAE